MSAVLSASPVFRFPYMSDVVDLGVRLPDGTHVLAFRERRLGKPDVLTDRGVIHAFAEERNASLATRLRECRWAVRKGKNIFISIPITGIPEEAVAEFREAVVEMLYGLGSF